MRFLFLLQYLILVISGSDISYLYATDWRPLLFFYLTCVDSDPGLLIERI
jgi:hypothetical protein